MVNRNTSEITQGKKYQRGFNRKTTMTRSAWPYRKTTMTIYKSIQYAKIKIYHNKITTLSGSLTFVVDASIVTDVDGQTVSNITMDYTNITHTKYTYISRLPEVVHGDLIRRVSFVSVVGMKRLIDWL